MIDPFEHDHEDLGELAKALAAASLEFTPILRDSSASIPLKRGGQIRFRYASLEAVLEAVRPALGKHGLALVHSLSEGKLTTLLLHSSGQQLSSVLPLPPVNGAQQPGQFDAKTFSAAVTSLRRAAVTALLGVAADDGDRKEEPVKRTDPGGPERDDPRTWDAGARLDDPEAIAASWRTEDEAKKWALGLRSSSGPLFGHLKHCLNGYAKALEEYRASLPPESRPNGHTTDEERRKHSKAFWEYWAARCLAGLRGEKHRLPPFEIPPTGVDPFTGEIVADGR